MLNPEGGSVQPMMLALSVVLGILPLLGIVWTIANGTLTSVDGLFMSLILLTLSGLFFLNAFIECAVAGLHALVARTDPLLPPAQPRGRSDRVAPGVLAGHWIGLRNLVSLGKCSRPAALSRLLLSRRPHYDRPVHQHLYHDVGDRRPQGRVPAIGDGSAGATLCHRAGESSGGNDPGHGARPDLSSFRAFRGRAHEFRPVPARGPDGVSGFIRAHRTGIRDRLADGFDLGVSRNHQLVPDSALAALRSDVSADRRFCLAPLAHAH